MTKQIEKGNPGHDIQKLTLSAFAESKRLPQQFLSKNGVRETAYGISFSYCDMAGNELRIKHRALSPPDENGEPQKDRHWWAKGEEPVGPYGAEWLDTAFKAGWLVLDEGESDTLTFRFHQIPGVGIPGADRASVLSAEHIDSLETIYVVNEKDDGGTTFINGVKDRLSELGFAGKVYEIRMPEGFKDPSDLHIDNPERFRERFEECLKAATPLALDSAPKRIGGARPQTPEQWGAVASLVEIAAESFPLAVFPRPMREMAEAIALSMPCPVDMPACAMLVAAATAIGTTRQLRIKSNWFESPRLWIALVAKPGTKKSPASNAANRPIREAQKRLRKEYKQAVEQYNAEKLAWKEKVSEARENGETPPPEPEEPVEFQVFTTDTTRESLAQLLQENKRGLVLIRDELTGWARSLNQYKGGKGDDKQFWLSLWSGETVVVNRREYKLTVDDPFTCVFGNIPPDVLGELNDEKGREDGFIHRILFSWPGAVNPGWTDCEPHPDTIAAYSDFFESLFRLKAEHDENGDWRPRTLTFTNAAKQLFADFVNELARDLIDEEFPDSLRGPWSKMEGYCARLALVLHVCRLMSNETDGEDVDDTSVRGALRLARYFMAHARRVYPRLTSRTDKAHENALAVQQWILRNRARIEQAENGRPAMTFTWYMVRRDLHTRFEGREEDLQKALAMLEGRGFLREIQRDRAGNTGRNPKASYAVNPAIWCEKCEKCQNVPNADGCDTFDTFGPPSENENETVCDVEEGEL